MGSEGPFRRLLRHMRSHRGTLRLASFCSVTNKVWDLAPPLLIGLAVDVVVMQQDSFIASYGLVDPWHQLVLLSVLTFIIWGMESLFEYFYGVLWRNLAQTVQHELRFYYGFHHKPWMSPLIQSFSFFYHIYNILLQQHRILLYIDNNPS